NEATQLKLKSYKKDSQLFQNKLITTVQQKKPSLFANERSKLVLKYANTYKFFHYQLEFIEVFKERGGFDVIVGNPPWVNIEMDEAGIISEIHPQVAIRKFSAPQVNKFTLGILNENEGLRKTYIEETIWAESTKIFLGS